MPGRTQSRKDPPRANNVNPRRHIVRAAPPARRGDCQASRPIEGTTGWKRYDIVLNIPRESVDIAFGYLLAGRGEVWAADLKLEKVAAAVHVTARAPMLPRRPVNLDFEQ